VRRQGDGAGQGCCHGQARAEQERDEQKRDGLETQERGGLETQERGGLETQERGDA
jgi:hypothetical protein